MHSPQFTLIQYPINLGYLSVIIIFKYFFGSKDSSLPRLLNLKMSPKKLQIKMPLAHIYGQSNVTNKTKTNPLLKTQNKK